MEGLILFMKEYVIGYRCYATACSVFLARQGEFLSFLPAKQRNSAFEQGNLDLWRYINAFIIIIIKTPCYGRARKGQYDRPIHNSRSNMW